MACRALKMAPATRLARSGGRKATTIKSSASRPTARRAVSFKGVTPSGIRGSALREQRPAVDGHEERSLKGSETLVGEATASPVPATGWR
jgi:hypothetical protein